MVSKDRKKLTHSMISVLAIVFLVVGITFAWLVNRRSMITLAPVIHPGNIAITGPGGTAMESLDLSYTTADIVVGQDGTKSVKIHREFCIKSTEEQFELELVHTTNMKNLTFSLYKGNDTATSLEGSYLNEGTGSSSNHHYVNGSKHSINFEKYNSVQAHAEPIYWKVNGFQQSDTNSTISENYSGEEITYYLTDYTLEISWTEATKETDIFYVLARNVEQQ